jgi:hypothetical protein
MSPDVSVVKVMAAALAANQDRYDTDAVDPRVLKAAVVAHQSLHARAPEREPPPDAIPIRKERATLAQVDNPAGGSAPPLTLWKRASEQEGQPMASFSDLIKSADQLIRSGDLEGANDCLERADAMVEKAKAHNNTVDDDGDDFDSPSDPTNDDDDSDEDDDVKKADEHYHLPHYGSTPTPSTPSSYGRGPDQQADPYATGSNPTGGPPMRTRFDAKVDAIQERDGVSRHIAMSTARLEAPKLYMEHQNSLSEAPTRNQHRRGTGQANKSAPTFWEDCVSAELAKGASTMEVASQRAAQQFGYDAFNNRMLAKGSQDIEARFKKIVKRIADTEGCGLETATREARLRNPTLVKAMNSI